MYSMVLMMAMTASPESVACGKTSCYGCTGYSCQGYVVTSCHGCTGFTSCRGCTGYTSCCGCHGGGLFSRFKGCHGCTGYTSCHGCTGYTSCCGCTGTAPIPVAPKKEMPMKTSAPATITVSVPADAKITIDGAATKSTSTVRVFSTPELPVGSVYYYTITAEVVRDGKTLTASEKIAVEAGTSLNLNLAPSPAPTVASK
jgi:uncharacterized protein (TIGR03000 family)